MLGAALMKTAEVYRNGPQGPVVAGCRRQFQVWVQSGLGSPTPLVPRIYSPPFSKGGKRGSAVPSVLEATNLELLGFRA